MKLKTFFALILLLPVIAMAGVNPKNGNFYITYRDIAQQSGGHELDLTRTYNSLSTEIGWFGFGWGSPFETRMIVMPDGSVAVHEQGTGRFNFYRPGEKADIQSGVARIVETAIRRNHIATDAADALRQSLIRNEELRVRKVLQYDMQIELPLNTVLASGDCSAAVLTRIAKGYKRTDCEQSNDYLPAVCGCIEPRDSSNACDAC